MRKYTYLNQILKSIHLPVFAIRRIGRMAGKDAVRQAYFEVFLSQDTYGVLFCVGLAVTKTILSEQIQANSAIMKITPEEAAEQKLKTSVYLPCYPDPFLPALGTSTDSNNLPTHSYVHHYNTQNREHYTIPNHRIHSANFGRQIDVEIAP